jgi:peptide/nickel transport system substrate-binding protein
MFTSDYRTGGLQNWWGVSDPTLDGLLDKLAGTVEPKARLDASVAAQVHILKNAYAIPVVDVYYPYAMRKEVADVYYPPFSWPSFYQAWIAPR